MTGQSAGAWTVACQPQKMQAGFGPPRRGCRQTATPPTAHPPARPGTSRCSGTPAAGDPRPAAGPSRSPGWACAPRSHRRAGTRPSRRPCDGSVANTRYPRLRTRCGVDLSDARVFPLEVLRPGEEVGLGAGGCGHGLICSMRFKLPRGWDGYWHWLFVVWQVSPPCLMRVSMGSRPRSNSDVICSART